MATFSSFVLFAEMRTGSNFLEENLNAMKGVTCHGELFNPHFIGKKDRLEYLGLTMADRAADPLKLLRAVKAADGLNGFRYFHDHDPRVLPAVVTDPSCAKIVLTRNPLESYVSWKIARATDQWKLTDAKNLRSAKVAFDAVEFEAHVTSLQAFQVEVMNVLQTSGQTAFYIDYEDINDLDVLNGLAQFLGAPPLDALDDKLKKQNPDEILAKLSNPEDVPRGLARLDRFNLSRTPNFEPRRPPAVPGFMASGDAGLLYMPIRSGPVEEVGRWLASFGGVETNFTQKSLRQWLRARPNHRSFTVLRHPVARAYDAFCRRVMDADAADLRQQLLRAYKLPLPDTLGDTKLDHAAFLAFLKWLKPNLAGQTSIRVDPHWASQTAQIQGFGQFISPDLMLREDRLAEGLAFLCEDVGVAAKPFTAPKKTALAAIYTPEIEEAAREAYARDYLAFGFGNWV